MDIVCFNCKHDNPIGSKFCNKCGIQLPLTCPHCGNSNNLPEAVYCNQCGLQVKKKPHVKYGGDGFLQGEKSQPNQYNYNGFHEYSLPEYNFKIRCHPEWEKTDKEELKNLLDELGINDSTYVVIFKPSIYHLHSSISHSLIIHVFDFSATYSLRDCVAIQIRDLKQDYPDFLLDNSKSLVINGKTWHWLSYHIKGYPHLRVFTFSENKLYFMRFTSEPDEYTEFLPILESMIDSFEFIYSTRLDDVESSRSQDMTIKGDFIEFSDFILRFKINYPTSWVKMIKPDEKNVVYFQKLQPTSNDIPASFVITVVDLSVPMSDTNKNLDELKKKAFKELNVEEEVSTTLGGLPASQFRSKTEGLNRLSIICENSSKIYVLTYLASPDSYIENFMAAEQMISSFEFL